jgi:hypothetical protein
VRVGLPPNTNPALRCPVDGTELRRTEDVVDELTEATIDESGSVKQVLAGTSLAEHLVGARLRFSVPDLHHQPATEVVDDQADRRADRT